MFPKKIEIVAGVDEVGRGPLAGPVVCAAVVLDSNDPCLGKYRDSKKLSAKKRLFFYHHLRQHASAYALAYLSAADIDRLNILQATLQCMKMAVEALAITPDHVLIDGNRLPTLTMPATAIVGGDDTEPSIAAASIVAKVVRDRLMGMADVKYRGYGFAQHKGYGTKQHMEALRTLGASPYHRFSFAPVKRVASGIEVGLSNIVTAIHSIQ
ncbi:MAG: ribonuclease HII [Mariprofundaceae bacterium]|nr:ribonuclease HII [Mariprofundaceae bacterium]